jgi:hypothetical protein
MLLGSFDHADPSHSLSGLSIHVDENQASLACPARQKGNYPRDQPGLVGF